MTCDPDHQRATGRAVGRLLWSDGYAPLHDRFQAILDREGFDSFKDADHGIVQCRKIFTAALSTEGEKG